MTGPEHYREAEGLVQFADKVGDVDRERGRRLLAAAQIHATLALAAVTAEAAGIYHAHGDPS
jgi:hypothetical protein